MHHFILTSFLKSFLFEKCIKNWCADRYHVSAKNLRTIGGPWLSHSSSILVDFQNPQLKWQHCLQKPRAPGRAWAGLGPWPIISYSFITNPRTSQCHRAMALVVFCPAPKVSTYYWAPRKRNPRIPKVALVDFTPNWRQWKCPFPVIKLYGFAICYNF